MQTLRSSSRDVVLPDFARDGFQELIMPSYSKNVTLSNKLYIDFTKGTRGGWSVRFDVLLRAKWDELRAIYQDQFDNNEMLKFYDDDLGIGELPVFLSLPAARSINWRNEATRDVIIVLERENAVS